MPTNIEFNSTNRPTTSNTLIAEVDAAWQSALTILENEQHGGGYWTGTLSTSALSTATALSALLVARQQQCLCDDLKETVDGTVAMGLSWLISHQNPDGGFGDTDRSYSNIATTLLVLAAWELAAQSDEAFGATVVERRARAEEYVAGQGSWDGLRRRYGKDKTFVVPILSNCALAGLVPWQKVAALPFEAAWLPQDWYRWARMPVVSYAIPALVAIGQARFLKAPPRNALLRMLRRRAIRPTQQVLRRMQPASGGYLEAVPLTSFVLMNLAGVGQGNLPVAQDCVRFIIDSRLEDGSWPIDTNLATWVTSLSINSLSRRRQLVVRLDPPKRLQTANDYADKPIASASEFGAAKNSVDSAPLHPLENSWTLRPRTVRWLLRGQHKQRHPFTGANPGGWGWTNLSGAVPDADDTPAALLALHALDLEHSELERLKGEIFAAAEQGVSWLLRLQNRDGGWPTFCRGWGKLPFDRSGTDLTAHALRAIAAWGDRFNTQAAHWPAAFTAGQLQRASTRGLKFLARQQRDDGSWLPLWFGNQDRPDEDNPAYGTGRVLVAYGALELANTSPARRGIDFLRNSQNSDGGWGGGPSVDYFNDLMGKPRRASQSTLNSSVEETAIALEGLLECGGDPGSDATIMRGLSWLAEMVQSGALDRATPIGFYFAKLWYYERLYPTIFSLGALGSALRKFERAELRSASLPDASDNPRAN